MAQVVARFFLIIKVISQLCFLELLLSNSLYIDETDYSIIKVNVIVK